MAGPLARLCQFLFEDRPLSPGDLLQGLRSDQSVKLGLQQLYGIIKCGLEPIAGEDKLRFQSWSSDQVRSVVSLGCAIAYASRSLAADQLEQIIFSVLRRLVEFSVSFLTKLDASNHDLCLQNEMLQFLEMTLVDGVEKANGILHSVSVNYLLELLLSIPKNNTGNEFDDQILCGLQGMKCLKGEKSIDRLLLSLASECLESDKQVSGLGGSALHQDRNTSFFLYQHWAVVHLDCIGSLVALCNEIFKLPDVPDVNFRRKLTFALRVLKLLGRLAKDMPYVEYDVTLLQAVASFSDQLPKLFSEGLEFASHCSASEGCFESLVLSLLEEFLHVVKTIFCKSSVFYNIKACIISSILHNVDSSVSRSNQDPPSVKFSLVYFPRTIAYLLKLIQELRRQSYDFINMQELDADLVARSVRTSGYSPSCHACLEEVPLVRSCRVDELMMLIFPPSSQWLDNLMHLIYSLHSECINLKPKLEMSVSSNGKANLSLDLENVVCHDDEALFGNLFSESCRSAGSTDVSEQSAAAVSSSSIEVNMPLQAASDILNFLKTCIFSREWLPCLYVEACKNLKENHIDILLSIMNCSNHRVEDGVLDFYAVSHEERRVHVHEHCFELLQHLLTHNALPDACQEYLVRRIMNVENDLSVCNHRTLALVAHVLFCRVGLAGSDLRLKMYNRSVSLMLEKLNASGSRCPTMKELLVTLPSAFHIEILLMTFHLSSQEEKVVMVTTVLSALSSINVQIAGFSVGELSCWGLLISRLVLLLRHMLLHPNTCPSSMLLDLRSKLRDAPAFASHISVHRNENLASLASAAANTLMSSLLEEMPLIRSLISQLIDIVAIPSLFRSEDLAVASFGLNYDELRKTVSRILGFWEGKRAVAVEDLIVERYIFVLCWDIAVSGSAADAQLFSGGNMDTPDVSSVEDFMKVSHLLLNYTHISGKEIDFQKLMFHILQQLNDMNMENDLGWGFLRYGSWVSLALSTLHVGIWRYCAGNDISGVGILWTFRESTDEEFVCFAENLVSSLVETGQVGQLVEIFSSLLTRYVQAYEKAFLSVIGDSQNDSHLQASLLILKHRHFDRSLRYELLRKCGISSALLESMFDVFAKLDATVGGRSSGVVSKVFWECMLHGFPCHFGISSGALLSCLLNIRLIVSVLDGLVKMNNLRGTVSLDACLSSQVLDSLMTIKFDHFFEDLNGKCGDILQTFCAGAVSTDYAGLFLLKDMERFLRDVHHSKFSNAGVVEWVITTVIDSMNGFRKDPSHSSIFKFYLGGQEASELLKKFHASSRNDLSFLTDLLDSRYSETVDVKVLNLLTDLVSEDLYPDLRQKLYGKFISMDINLLSKWFEERLLGCIVRSPEGVQCTKESSASLRESTKNFILCLVLPLSEQLPTEMHDLLFEAILTLLDPAFLLFHIPTAKSYFSLVVQLAKGERLMKLLLNRTIMLMQKLACEERLLPGLRFLFGFLGCLLDDYGTSTNAAERDAGKSFSSSSIRMGSMDCKPMGSTKNPDTLLLSPNQEGMTLECDATSVDEDEDDGTSDGDVASLDKDEEEDATSERALAYKVCTFTSSGSNFMEQHWYFCYTCDLTVSKGCCSVCAKVCHRGHRVVYSRSSRFFCDCGAGGVRGSSCQCLKPRKFTGTENVSARAANNFQSLLPLTEDAVQMAESDSDMDEEVFPDMENSFGISLSKELRDVIPVVLEELDIEGRLLGICSIVLPSISSRRESNLSKDKIVLLGKEKVLSYVVELLQLKKAYKSGSLDLKIKADYTNAKELRSHLASGSLVKSLLSVSVRGRLAVGEGDKVAIFDVGQLIGQATIAPVTADKTNVKPLSRNIVRFEIVHLVFNTVVENYLAVAGYEDCQVLTVNPRGEVTDRLAIELALQGAYIRRIEWVPGSQVQLLVVTNRFVKIYDLSQDNISPMHYITLPDDAIMDATLFVSSQGRMFLIVLSENGSLFKLELSMEGNVGAKQLTERIHVQDTEIHAKGSSLYFSVTCKLLVVSYQDGTTLIGRLHPNATSLTEISCVYEEEQDGKRCPGALHRWKELLAGSGLFSCFSSSKPNSALVVSLGDQELLAQNLRHAVSSSSPLVGITAYKPLSKDKVHCLALYEDGSLQIYSYVPVGVESVACATAEKVKKLGSNILNNKAYASTKPEFPLDFFERTVSITADIKLGGDAIKNGDSEAAKQSLASEDGFLESPSPLGFKISVFNSNPDIVMVGFRVHVGNTSPSHIPSEISIFQRAIKLDEGMRSWYDVPFTAAESLLADEEFVVSVGPTFSGSVLPRVDSLEVYGRAKDEFGWKEKMDAVLDMEARVLGSNSVLAGSSKKCRLMQSASIQEQVVADALKIISRIYATCRSQKEEVRADLSKFKCKQLLEEIFLSDREPLMQAAACRILRALFPKKDIYFQVKDTLRLLGVVKSTFELASRLRTGGASGGWIIEEFTALMRAVSKIALHRRSNLGMLLEVNGSEVVDGLMNVLWEILDSGLPDTQTMNNIVVSSVELIYSYAECLAVHAKDSGSCSVAPAVELFKKLLFFPNEAVQASSSLAISSRLLQVPFPKQTMLANDDAENAIPSLPAETSVGNAEVLIEEDSITSSVHYCCDGCSTVPILRRRWHCTICPDFDLCEACYEVLDADHLPPPHSRDHPMTAMPIEVESLGGDGSEIHFSTDDANDSNLGPSASDMSMQTSAPSIHVLEPNESGELSASVTDPVSISASKRALNSLLLSELLEQLKGWMETTSGVRAIPVMQLFYRLSSAVGGPFIDISKSETLGLEKLIRWFLNEINLSRPFVAKTRSSFGEVAILVFMFFTLMLRNWHQPGSDGTTQRTGRHAETHERGIPQTSSSSGPLQSSLEDPEKFDFSSQLHQACNSLRNQTFVTYLMDILQQLMHVFKSPAVAVETAHGSNTGSGCGALLTVRKDLPAGNFSPFFSDSYAKAHRSDIFMDYHRLLLENAFRLVYTLVRPEKQDKNGEKERIYKMPSIKDLKLDGYQDVLCSYINNHSTTFVRRYARRLFLHMCGSKTQYYNIRDSWQFSTEMKKLHKHLNKSGGFPDAVPYERCVKIVKCLSAMAEVAAARPRNWQKYCLRHGDVLSFLISGIFHFGEEAVIQTLKLLSFAFYLGKDMGHFSHKSESGDSVQSSNRSNTQLMDPKKKKKTDEGIESGFEKSCMDMDAAVDIFADKGADVLRQFIDCFLLEWNSSSVRSEARSVLYGIWHHGKPSFKETMLTALLQKIKYLPMYGQSIVEYTELVTWLLGKVPDNNSKQPTELLECCLTPDVVRSIFDSLHSQNELIANHPNSRIYNTLSGLVELDGYYLESEPCVACSTPEVPYSRMKLESLKSETKFTDNRIIVKCTGSYTIQTVTMNVHDARKSKSVKVLNLYYNNRPVSDLSELKNNWSLWKRAKSCHLAFNQTELKVDFPIPITACNFMIELDSFYENLQALSLEPLQCPRCSRPVTDKHGICGNCHENAYQCRQCRNINYENLDSFLCNECGYSKYGRFEFNFMAKPSFAFDNMENDDDMKRGLAAIEAESENAHRRYQQLLGFKKPLLKIVSSIGESEMDSQQKDTVQQMMVSLPGPSCKINRKIALLGVLYGEKCKAAFDSVSKSVQTLQGLRRVLMNYLHQKHTDNLGGQSRFIVSRSPNNCYGCATTFVTQCLEILQVLARHANSRKQLVAAGILSELFENNIHQGPKNARSQARAALCSFSEGDITAVAELNSLIQKKVMYCLDHHRSMDIAVTIREEMLLLSEVCSLADELWEARLRVVFQLLFFSIKLGAKHPAISENVILPCLRIISQACTPPKPDAGEKEQNIGSSATVAQVEESGLSSVGGNKFGSEPLEKNWDVSQKARDIQLLSYSEWEKGVSYVDFVRRQYKVSQVVKGAAHKSRPQRSEYLALKYALRWKHRTCKVSKGDMSVFELGSWVTELVLSACSQSIRSEMCMLITLLCCQSSSRRSRLLNLLLSLLPASLSAGESAAEYFELLSKMIDLEDARLFLTVRGCLRTICKLITEEVGNIESLERSMHIDISQGFILHKLIELLGKFLEVPRIRTRFMRDNLLSEVLEALIVIRGLIVQKTKLISDCNRLLKELLDSLLLESSENRRQFIRACISGLQIHGKERKGRTCLFILEQLCNVICPSKPEAVYYLVLNKAHTQEEFIRGSMTKNPYSSSEIGPLMRDVKNKICHQLDLLGLLEDDYGMELLVAGNIISLDLSIPQVCEQVWKKSNNQSSNALANSALLSPGSMASSRDSPPMVVTYRLQGLDGEATEPMIKELEEDREESQDPEVEFAIAGAVREYGGLEILLDLIQRLRDDFKYNQDQLVAVLNLLMHCCKIRENRRALLKLGALGLLLETARRAFSVDAMEPAEGILLIVESLTLEANESDNINISQSVLTVTSEGTGTGEQAKKIVLMFLERLSHPSGIKKSNKQQRYREMVARILPYLTYGEPAAMEALIQHFSPYLQDWGEFDRLQQLSHENTKDESIVRQASTQRVTVENFVRVSESLKTSSCGERLKDILLEKGITGFAVRYLKERFSVTGQAGFRSTTEWVSALKLPSVPHILSMLRGLSMGHYPTQKCIDEGGILPLLHALESVPGENEIGARAENLLDTLADKEGKGDGFLQEKVRSLRHATRDEMRRRALRKREELLQGLGMRRERASDGGERIVVAQLILEGLEDVEEEEDGLACMVCREGYSLRPADLLGVYSYTKRVNLGIGASGSARGEYVYTTVSYFNVIHFQCHQEAKRADAALRNPKKEWEGATLRNNESLCNSLFPVKGPSVPLSQYVRYVDQFWDNLNALGRADGSRLRLVTYDIVLMLARFATGASFSAECRGGGSESNSRFLPFMIQMARHLLEQGGPSQHRSMAKAVATYLSSSVDSKLSGSTGTEETVQFMMVNSLLVESYESWLQHRRGFLLRGIYHAYMQHTHNRSTTAKTESTTTGRSPSAESGSNDLLSIVRPMLVYTGLIEQLHQFFKVKKSSNVASAIAEGSSKAAPEGEESGSLEVWEVVMKERLLNVKEMLLFSKELLSWLEDMNSVSDLQEAFDIIGALGDVLSGGCSRCEDFVEAAINAGKV